MTDTARRRALGYGVCAVLALAVSLGVARYRGADLTASFALNCRYLSDGFFFSGLIFTGVGGLTLIAGTGFFDVFGYAFHSLLVLFSLLRRPEDHVSYFDYKLERDAKRKKPLWAILITGLACIALSVACLMLYYHG